MHKKLFSIFVMFLFISAYVPSTALAQTPQSQAQSIKPEAKTEEPGTMEILLGKGKEFLFGKTAGPGLTQAELDSLERARIKEGFFSAAEGDIAREFEAELNAQNAQINQLTLDINELNKKLEVPSEKEKAVLKDAIDKKLKEKSDFTLNEDEKKLIQFEIDAMKKQSEGPSEEEKKKIGNQIAELNKEKATAEKKYSDYTKEMSIRAQHVQSVFVLTRINAESARIDGQRNAMSSAISGIKDTIDKINKNLKTFRSTVDDVIKAIDKLDPNDPKYAEKKAELEKTGGDAEKALNEEEAIRDAAEATLKQQQEDYKKLEQEFEQESKRLTYEKTVAAIDEKLAYNNDALFRMQKGLEASNVNLQNLQEALGKLDPKDPDYANKKRELEDKILAGEIDIDVKKRAMGRLNNKNLELEAEKRLEEFIDKISFGQGVGAFVSTVLGMMGAMLDPMGQYKGLAQFGALFIGDEEMQKRRQEINEEFCGTILGGTQCWASDICGKYIETSPQTQGLVVTTVSVGEPKVVAHVEGEKSLPAKLINDSKKITEFTYKITYYVSLSEGKDSMSYNIEFSNDELSEMFFPEDKQISSGGGEGRLLDNPILKSSNKDYYKVCLIITPPVISATGRKVNRLCNILQEYAGTATKPYEQVKAPKIPSRFLPPKVSSENVSFDAGVEPERKTAPRKELVKEPVEEITSPEESEEEVSPAEEPTVPEETAQEATPTLAPEESISTPVPEVVAPTETPSPVETAPEEATPTPVESAPEEPTPVVEGPAPIEESPAEVSVSE